MKEKKERDNLNIVKETAFLIERIGYWEYLRLLTHSLMQLSDSAHEINKKVESEAWESRACEIDEVIAKDVKNFNDDVGEFLRKR